MSDICGIIRFDGQSVTKEDIQKMLDIDQDFESDDQGIWTENNVGLGHNMLWITPESKYEKQPLLSEDNNLVLIADARIDNRLELIKIFDLKENNSEIITDADLILLAYQKWGKESPNHIYGDFSFAIWDNKKNEFFASRDRFGIRQFYYYYNKDILIFSSSLESIFSLDILSREIDMQSVKKYFKLRALNRDESFFKDIRRLPSSNWINVSSNKCKIERYWFPEEINTNTSISLEEATEKFSHLFDNAIKSCLRSSYPVSIEVSGGVDSGSIYSSVMSMDTSQEILAHTIQHRDLPSDETYYIEVLEKKFNSEIIKFDINNVDFKKYDLSYFYSKYPNWPQKGNFIEFVMKNNILNKRGIRVVLTGIGADEILGGNDDYMSLYFKKLKFKLLIFQLHCIEKKINSKVLFFKYIFLTIFFNPSKYFLKKTIKYLLSKIPLKKNPYRDVLTLDEIQYNQNIQNLYMESEKMYLLSSRFSYWMDYNPLQNYGTDGIEVRHPFLDTELVEFIISLPPEYLYHCNEYKSILKSVMHGILPKEILYRNNKTCLVPGIKLQMGKMYNNLMLKCTHLINNKLVDNIKIEKYRSKLENDTLQRHEYVDYWIITNLEIWLHKGSGND